MLESREDDRCTLPRVLGLWDATCVVVGAVIGVGIFFTPKDVARLSGRAGAALAAWGVGGLIALLGAITFAELGRMRPVAGGQYHVLRDAYGRLPAFLYVFCNLTAIQAGAVAIISIVCAENLGVALFGATPGSTWTLGMATVLTWLLVGANVIGVRTGAGLQNTTVVLKLAALFAVVVLAALAGPRPEAAPGVVGAGAAPAPMTFASLFAAVTITLFAYGGWQQGLWMAGEVKDAERNLPRSILLGIGVVLVTYLLAAGAVAISAFGVLNAQFLSGPRLTWAMASDGLFFAPFARLHARFATPAPAIVLLGVMASALTLGLGLQRTDLLITGVVVIDATFFALTGLALPVLQRRFPGAGRGAGWIALAAVAFAVLELLAVLGSLLQANVRLVALTGLGWIAAAALTWALFFRTRRAAGA
jgi:APA family basic amino acid/polyamine antiporter